MKRYISLITLAVFLGGLASLLIFMQAQAQVDAFTFFIPYPADILDNQLDVGNAAGNFVDEDIVTTISISILRDNTIIYYDHWEGVGVDTGLEANLTQPVQPSTEIWGDNDPSNGFPPGSPGDPALNAGDVIVLQNTVVVPRDPAQFFYDGGDKLTAIGGNIAVTLAVWPATAGVQIRYAGAWELYPTSRWGREYVAPVGENLDPQRAGFEVVGLNVQAALDGTTVVIDLDDDGTPEYTVTLNQGQNFTLTGAQTGIDAMQSVLSGSRVQVTSGGPIQVHLFTADPDRDWEARAYSLVPFDQWQNDYIAPRSSDGDYWLYNPHGTDLMVTVQLSATMTTLTIPAMSTARFSNNPVPPGMMTATGARFTSTDGRDFYGLVALDEQRFQDWGYALLPVANLTTQHLVGWGPSNDNPTPNGDESRVYVTAATTTTLIVRYSNGVTATFPITPLYEVPILDPPNTWDMTGAFLYTTNGVPFVSVWGQDQFAPIGSPSIDVGTGIVPLPALTVQKSVALIDDADGTGTITWGDTVAFTIIAYNNSSVNIIDGVIEDNLPANLTYIPGTSTVDGTPISDSGTTPFPFDEGGYNVGVINNLSQVRVTFQASVNDNVDAIENGALASAPGVSDSDPGGIIVPLQVPRYELDKHLISPANGQAASGQVITFGITITSTGNITITKLPLRDTFDETRLTFLNATPAPDIIGTGVITWSDLATTTVFGPLGPGRVINLTVAYVVGQIPITVTNTINVITVEGAEGIDGSPLPTLSDNSQVFFSPPTPTPTPPSSGGGGSGGGGSNDDDGGSPPTPTPTPMPPPPTPPQPTPALPVLFLPETGLRGTETGFSVGSGGIIALFALFSLGFTFYYLRKKSKN